MNVTEEMVDVAVRIAFPLNSMANPVNERIRAKVRDALTAAIALMRGQAWQPIETAPRDGTRFVIWSDAAKDYVIVRFSGEHFTDDHANPWVCWRLWSYLPTQPKDPADEQ